MYVCCECCVLSGRGLCDELITRLEESYRLWCVVVCDLETSWLRRTWPTGGFRAKNKHTNPKTQSPLHVWACKAFNNLFHVRVPSSSGLHNPSPVHLNLLAPELLFFFLISAHPVYKMWIIQEPNNLALWNKLHFEEEKTESIEHV